MTIAFKEIQYLLPKLKGKEYIALMADILTYIDTQFIPKESEGFEK